MHIFFLEPYFGGSHRAFAEGLQRHAEATVEIFSLPDRFWKWRMRGAALYFSRILPPMKNIDVVITSDMLNLADLKALRTDLPPVLVYFHENQLSYPVPQGKKIDYHFGFTNITTALTANRVLFNSQFQMESFLTAAEQFIGKMPDYQPDWVIEEIKEKAEVVYPGVELPDNPALFPKPTPPLIIWNHRWEFDKNPEDFFAVLEQCRRRGHQFRLALMGESFQNKPKAFIHARTQFSNELTVYGYVEDRSEYLRILEEGSVVISTALQENFGFSIVESIRCGTVPLLPNRLAYPEVLPRQFHHECIYTDREDCARKLSRLLTGEGYKARGEEKLRRELSESMHRYDWSIRKEAYNRLFEEIL